MAGSRQVVDRSGDIDRLMIERATALAQVAALTRNFDAIVEASELVSTDDEHDPEGATIAFERAQVSALLRQAHADSVSIDEALERVRAGRYGWCVECGREVGAARLEAIPFATRCISCAA